MQHNGERTSVYSPIICARLLEILILHLCEISASRSALPASAHETFVRCRTYMENHFRQLTCLMDIARACNVDATYLCRLFHEHAGLSPHKLLLLKIRRAAELLATGNMRVKEVANDVGFRDPYHFSKVFKRTYGIAPAHFLMPPHPARHAKSRQWP